MAKIDNLKAGVDKIKDHAFEINDFTINTADDVVDVVLKNSREWQKLFGRVVKNGSKLLWKQQDLALSALENVSDQIVGNNQKLAEFLEVDNFLSVVKSSVKKTSKKANAEGKKKAKVKKAFTENGALKSKAEKKAKKATKKAKKVTKTIVLQGAKATKTVATQGAKVTKKVIVKGTDTAKTVATQGTKITKKVAVKGTKAAKTVATKGVRTNKATGTKVVRNVRKDNLRNIKGIGVKTEALLNNEGIYSFTQLAKASKKKLEAILENAGPRFANFDPTEWTKEAVTFAAKAKKV